MPLNLLHFSETFGKSLCLDQMLEKTLSAQQSFKWDSSKVWSATIYLLSEMYNLSETQVLFSHLLLFSFLQFSVPNLLHINYLFSRRGTNVLICKFRLIPVSVFAAVSSHFGSLRSWHSFGQPALLTAS